MPPWQTIDYALLALMPALLVLSAFFSGSETALFGMREVERAHFRRGQSIAARAVQSLLSDQRLLLITLMLGNMTVNSVYFVVSSVLMLRSGDVVAEAIIAIGSLLAIVLFGEVLPKMFADARRTGFATVVAPLLLAIHRLMTPLRAVVARFIVTPLSRLTAPADVPPQLSEEELQALLDISGRQGVIDAEEQRVLREVFSLSRLKVRHVMTPRVRMHALPIDATRSDVIEMTRRSRLTRLPVYESDLDNIVGMLHVKRYLLSSGDEQAPLRPAMTPARFVPQMVTLDELLEQFRQSHSQVAVVVDEFGGTAGIVAIRDVVEELVGEIVGADEIEVQAPQAVGAHRWRVSGDFDVHDWAEAFGQRLVSPRVATLGGLIMQRLGRPPEVGDAVELGNVRVEVEQVEKARVASAIVTLLDGPSAAGESP